jgi:hypothetical protein
MPTRHGTSRSALGWTCACTSRTTRADFASPTTPSPDARPRTRRTPGLLPSWAPLPALLSRSGCRASTSRIQPPGLPPLSASSSRCTRTSYSTTPAPISRCSTARAAVCAGGSAAANAGAHPQPQPAGSQDNGHGKLVLPQLNGLHEAFNWSQVSHPASSGSQDQLPTRRPSPIPSQRRLTQQLTKHWPQFKALRQHTTPALARVLRSSASSTCLKSARPQSRNEACAWR